MKILSDHEPWLRAQRARSLDAMLEAIPARAERDLRTWREGAQARHEWFQDVRDGRPENFPEFIALLY
jgi:hypothetical protein